MQKIIGVKMDDSGKIAYCFGSGIEYKVGSKVVVDADNSLLLGTVCFGEKEVDDLETSPATITRIASAKDLERAQEQRDKAKKALEVTKQKVSSLRLNMKVVDAVYTLDGGKVIISFVAEDRVDFRELLRELASSLHARIELKQIGQRDEVKIKGGIGPCGEVCCCKRFLGDFEHVTVKMAKNQGLSLNPTKISGLCGRLMCCLAYENPTYEEVLSKMPKVGSSVKTPDGVGTAIYNDILRECVSVKFVSGDETSTINVYDLSQISFENRKEKPNGLQNKSK